MQQHHMHIDMGEGHVFAGTPVEIVAQMQRVAIGVDDLDIDEYVEWVTERAATLEGVYILVAQGGIRARAESLLRGLVDAGLARDLDAWDDLDDEARPTLRFGTATALAAVG